MSLQQYRFLGVLGVLAVVSFAFYLRFHNLEAQSLWNDEGNSFVQATRSFADIAVNAARDIHPPGYYLLLAVWRQITGDTEFALRALSAFASVLTVAFTYALGRRLFGAFAGLIAALFVTLNTFNIYYAQEARMYALLALWSAASLWILANILDPYPPTRREDVGTRYIVSLRQPQIRWALALGLVNAAGLYTQYAYALVILAQAVMVVVWIVFSLQSSVASLQSSVLSSQSKAAEPKTDNSALSTQHSALGNSNSELGTRNFRLSTQYSVLSTFFLANALALLLFLPWLPTAWAQVMAWPNTGQPVGMGEALQTILGWLAYGLTFEATAPATLPYVPIFLAVGLAPFHAARPRWGRILFPVIALLVIVGLFLALGLFRPANLKFLLPAQIAFALWMGRTADVMWWAARTGPRPSPLLMAAVALSFGVVLFDAGRGVTLLYDDPRFQRADYRAIAAAIADEATPDDAIILDAPNQEEVFRYYYKGDTLVYPLPRGLGGDDAVARAEVRDIIANHDRIFAVFWGEAERDPNRVVETTLDTEAFEAGENVWYGDVRLARYAAPAEMPPLTEAGAHLGDSITLEGYALSSDHVQPGEVLQLELQWQTDAPLDTRYKVFVQLLDGGGRLATQRDSEPGGGLKLTTTWQPNETITDRHGLLIPTDLAPGSYTLIIGLYDLNNPAARLPVEDGDYLELGVITVQDG
ncbi:MAG: glycosyltransferase family 39 protein [Chloroflexi bacterium]|nr:glycosyltransferase family 39 protein [Chloroflexota bacterium]